MSLASEFWRSTIALIEDRLQKQAAFKAKVTSVTVDGVQFRTFDSTTASTERYAKLKGSSIVVGDTVAVIPIGSSYLVLGVIEPST